MFLTKICLNFRSKNKFTPISRFSRSSSHHHSELPNNFVLRVNFSYGYKLKHVKHNLINSIKQNVGFLTVAFSVDTVQETVVIGCVLLGIRSISIGCLKSMQTEKFSFLFRDQLISCGSQKPHTYWVSLLHVSIMISLMNCSSSIVYHCELYCSIDAK